MATLAIDPGDELPEPADMPMATVWLPCAAASLPMATPAAPIEAASTPIAMP